MKDIRDMGIGESFYLKETVVTISTRTGTPCEFDEERIDINDLIIAELEKIKEKVKQRKILPKTSARSDYEMGLIDGRSTEKVAIMGIIKKEIAELKGE